MIPVCYTKDAGASIAYQVFGEAPRDLVFVPGFVSQLEMAWEEPFFARFMRGLSSFARVIWFDKRGTGLSDPIPDEPSPRARADEILAVMEAAGSSRATIFGVSEGASLAILFAVTHPERCSSLITFSGFARLLKADDYPAGWSQRFFDAFVEGTEEAFATGSPIEYVNPSLTGDARYREWFARYLRSGASPSRARTLMLANAELDLRDVLSDVDIPTLALHRTDENWVSVEQSRYLASKIPGAKLVELHGVDHWPWIGDADSVLVEVEAFMTGVRRSKPQREVCGRDSLTPREAEVARLAVAGLSAKEIADELTISERTAESHIANIYAKLGVTSRVELVVKAKELGL